MGFKFKALVAAVAIAAVAGPAAAADTNAATGSDLLFYVWDNAAGNSFVLDLGQAGNFGPTTAAALSQGVASAAWTSFMQADANWMANAQWGVVTGYNLNPVSIGTTVTKGVSTSTTTNTGVTTAVSQVQLVFTALPTVLTGAGATYYGTGSGYDNVSVPFVNGSGASTYGDGLFSAGNAIGATGVAFDQVLTTSGRGAVPTVTAYAGKFSFDGTTVAYAVPEPESYAMMLAGLVMLGAIARRRSV